MGNVTFESFQVSLHCLTNIRRDMVVPPDCMEDVIAFGKLRSKSSSAHLKPSVAFTLVMCGSKCTHLKYGFLVCIIIHVISGELEEMFIVFHSSMVVRENFAQLVVPRDIACFLNLTEDRATLRNTAR